MRSVKAREAADTILKVFGYDPTENQRPCFAGERLTTRLRS